MYTIILLQKVGLCYDGRQHLVRSNVFLFMGVLNYWGAPNVLGINICMITLFWLRHRVQVLIRSCTFVDQPTAVELMLFRDIYCRGYGSWPPALVFVAVWIDPSQHPARWFATRCAKTDRLTYDVQSQSCEWWKPCCVAKNGGVPFPVAYTWCWYYIH